jgi:hypothetical protein
MIPYRKTNIQVFENEHPISHPLTSFMLPSLDVESGLLFLLAMLACLSSGNIRFGGAPKGV